MNSTSNQSNNNLLLVIIAGMFAVIIAMGAGMFYLLTQNNQQQVQVVPQAEQLSAAEIAQIVKQTLSDTERENIEQALAAKLAPWKAADGNKDLIYGNPNARFSIVTFSDLECPFCKRFNNTPKEVVDASGDAVNFEFKHMPLDFHNPAALKGALMVECVAKWKGNQHAVAFVDQYFQKTQTNGAGVADLDGLARSFGLTAEQISSCEGDPVIAKRVQDDVEFGAKAGVTGTPSSFVVDTVGGKSIQIGGAQGAQVFMNAIRSMLEDDENEEAANEADETETDVNE